jgi:pilus assembly protein Flp/PilA
MDKCARIEKPNVVDALACVAREVFRVKRQKRVCAWCQKVMAEGEEPVTHGICPDCAVREIYIFLGEKEVQEKRGPANSTGNGQTENDGLIKKGEEVKRMEKLRNFVKEEDGVTAIEYGLIAALVSVLIITAVTSIGNSLKGTFETIAAALTPQ